MLDGSNSEREESDDELDEQLDSQMRQYFSNTTSKPLSHLLLWRRRHFTIALVTMVNRPAVWDLAKTTLIYLGISISMDKVCYLCKHALERAQDQLYSKLMFRANHILKLTLVHLNENDTKRKMSQWFGKHASNSALLNGYEQVLVEHVTNTSHLRNLYIEERLDDHSRLLLFWRRSSIRLYQQIVQEFLRELLVLIHFGASPLVFALELLSLMWYNTEQLRHI